MLVSGVTNTDVAVPNARGLRGFNLAVSATGGQGDTDGPVQTLYSIDPNATAEANSTEDTETDGNATALGGPPGTDGEDTTVETPGTPDSETSNGGETMSEPAANGSAADATTNESTMAPATTEGNNVSGGQATETDGPGFGLVVSVVALLAAGLLATRRRD